MNEPESSSIVADKQSSESNTIFSDPRADTKRYPPNMLGMALLLAECIRDWHVFVEDIGKSFYYDGTRWRLDKSENNLHKLILEFVLYLESLVERTDSAGTKGSGKSKDSDASGDPYEAITNTLLSPGSWSSLIKAYKTCNFIEHSFLDNNGLQRENLGLFNCLNGTLELNTMEFYEHQPGDFITKISGVEYDEDAKCEEWLNFIDQIMCCDKELARYLQKVCGYALTADTRLECMFILYGPRTRNGKSTFVDALLNVFGDYGKSVQPATIAQRGSSNGSAPSSDIARLVGSRFVSISEPPAGLNMDGARIKQITGNDKIASRFLFNEFFEYIPQFKMVVNTNHLPNIDDDTLFASERLKVVPFNNFFGDKPNKGLKHLFREPGNMSAILNWLLEGLRLYK